MATKQQASKARTPARTPQRAPAPPNKAAGREVARAEDNVDVRLLMEQDSGDGVSTAAEDNIIPLIYILQAQSPQALKQKPEYIKGAEAGNIWPRGSKTLIDGEGDGLPIIPVAFNKWWMEWRPDRGGYAGRHPYNALDENKGRPADATWVEDPKKPSKSRWVREDGNELVETREHAVLAYINGQWTGAVISMSGSNHTASRMWMGAMKDKRIPNTDKRAPSYAYVYCAKTIAKSNDDGDWYGWVVEDGMGDGEVTLVPNGVVGGGPGIEDGTAIYRAARQLAADFKSGVKVAEAPAARDDVGGTADHRSDDEDGM